MKRVFHQLTPDVVLMAPKHLLFIHSSARMSLRFTGRSASVKAKKIVVWTNGKPQNINNNDNNNNNNNNNDNNNFNNNNRYLRVKCI